MLKIQEIRELIKLIDQSSIDEFKYEHEGSVVSLKKNEIQTVQAAPVQQQVETRPVEVASAPAPAEQSKETATAAPAQKEEVQEKETDESLHKIKSPMVGTFYAKPSPDADNYVKKGDSVDEESIVCIIEAMKLFNEIEAEVKGEIVEILVEDGQLVEYDQPLFLVK
ncbi:acetyl-CoA carboxylase biotin carboxyl carrier protein [Pseudalkalibacillus caeni]|uniref:Biotin carboxyl carrier protein of acetyl-CoA carboxylase n=1 Tax=Exobacillus caeni TaxID=2574798 RepID=A0A5R9EYI8_9BACL|nr:acetyl-CoA carboxylase biotin carboxyl carrier protein [Pseudalkalibacillus caeni]TLS36372.1 acetyl-CoA carboxylase biotin carboxyl carrier protein [Pseudalkalibacillus caeni]